MKFGIPRGLYYEPFLTEWKVFLEELGHNVEISPPTNKDILDVGVKEGVNEACISLKLTIGHSIYLGEKVDFIFAPRLMNLDRWRRITLCPKFRGLPDIIRVSVPRVFSVNAYVGTFWRKLNFYIEVGRHLGHSLWKILKAYREAVKVSERVSELMQAGFWPDEAREVALKDINLKGAIGRIGKENLNRPCIGVIGYPYLIYDRYVSHSLIMRLVKMGFNVVTPEMIDAKEIESSLKILFKPLFWSQSNKVLGAALALLKSSRIEGMIHVSSFSCGTDAWVGRLIEIEAKRVGKPLMRIVVDEHTAEAGLVTRLEAFTDLVRWRKGRAVV